MDLDSPGAGASATLTASTAEAELTFPRAGLTMIELPPLKRGDYGKVLKAQLTLDGVPVDLSDVDEDSIKFIIRPIEGGAGVERDAEFQTDGAATGLVQYTTVADDTAVAGQFLAEFEVTIAASEDVDESVQTYPEGDYYVLTIIDDLSPPAEEEAP